MPESRQHSRTAGPAPCPSAAPRGQLDPPAGRGELDGVGQTLTMARCRWPGSPLTTTPRRSRCTSTSTPPRRASGASSSAVCCTSSPRSTSCRSTCRPPDSIRLRTSRSSISPRSRVLLRLDDAEHRALLRRQLAGVTVLQQLQVAADGRQRRAQLVADRGQEVGLLPVQPLEPVDVVPLVGLVLGLHQDARGEGGDLLDGVGLGPGPPACLVDRQDEDHRPARGHRGRSGP